MITLLQICASKNTQYHTRGSDVILNTNTAIIRIFITYIDAELSRRSSTYDVQPSVFVSQLHSYISLTLARLRNHFASSKHSTSSAHANFLPLSFLFIPSFWLLPDCWAERSHHQIHHCRVIAWGNTGPIMAINNNGRAHLAWWLMGLSHSSFTWLLCGHQQLRSNVMLSKWAFHRILSCSRVEQRHRDGTYLPKHGSETQNKKRSDDFVRRFRFIVPLRVAIHAVEPCLCMCLREREVQVHPSASISVTWREIDCVCVVR